MGSGWVVVGVSVVWCAGCGGRVLGERYTGVDSGPSLSGTPAENAGSGGNDFASEPLPACNLGFLATQANGRDCNFVVAGRCYDDKNSACGCACPRDRTSTCISDFGETNGRVAVTCE